MKTISTDNLYKMYSNVKNIKDFLNTEYPSEVRVQRIQKIGINLVLKYDTNCLYDRTLIMRTMFYILFKLIISKSGNMAS